MGARASRCFEGQGEDADCATQARAMLERGSQLGLEQTSIEELNEITSKLAGNKDRWMKLRVSEKLRLLGELLEIFQGMDHEAWAKEALTAAGWENLQPEPMLASEMIMNTRIIGSDLETLVDVLATLHDTGKAPEVPVRWEKGRAIAEVFPRTMQEKMGREKDWKVEVWMTGETATQGKTYRRDAAEIPGKCCLLLGAGNQGLLSICDILNLLFVEGMVCIIKHNSVRAYNHKWTQELFAPLIREGFMASVLGGVPESQLLLHDPRIDHVHMTGGKATHDAIVWGGSQRTVKKLLKPITSELGAVTPYIIGPGDWKDDELQHHAAYFTTVLMQNNSCNCNAPQVLLLPASGFPSQKFLAMVKAMVAKRPHNAPYYPGTHARHKAWLRDLEGKAKNDLVSSEVKLPPGSHGPPLPWVFSQVDFAELAAGDLAIVSHTEAFGPMLAISTVPGSSYWAQVADFCNDKLLGSLSCVVIMHPSNQSEEVIQKLKYGSIGVNSWGGQSFGFNTGTWGAYPGEQLESVESGIGYVRNYLLFEEVEKTVVYAPLMTPMHIGTAPQPPALAEAKMMCNIFSNNIHTERHNQGNGYCEGNFRPIEEEGVHSLLVVEGTLPKELTGCYVRGGVNARYKPHGKIHMFDGDAMLHAFVLQQGLCTSYANTWLRTPRFLANEAAGKECYPHIGDIAMGGLEVAKKLGYMGLQQRTGRTPALQASRNASPATSTALIGKGLYACVEINSPFRIFIDPTTGVVTSGSHQDWDGKVLAFSAHSKLDAKTGEVCFFSGPPISAGAKICRYGVFDKTGALKQNLEFQCGAYPPPAFLHDHFMTKNFAICVDHSLRGDMSKVSSTGYFVFDPSRTLRFGVLPRDATDDSSIEWYDTGKPGFVWHCVAAFETDETFTLWLPIFDDYAKDLPIHLPSETDSFLHKVVLNRKTKRVDTCKKFLEVGVTERCAVNEAAAGYSQQRYAYLMLRGKEEMYNGFAKFDLRQEQVVSKVDYGPMRFGGEAIFVPRPGGEGSEDDGWLMDVIYDRSLDSSELCIWDAKLSDGDMPLAKVKAPHRIPYGVHGNFLTPEQLQAQWEGHPGKQ